MINLFYNYYKEKKEERKSEIDFCLQRNISNKLINTIIIESQEKLSFSYFFKKINLITLPDDINIICNSDIYLDETISECLRINHDECYALTRWDVKSNGEISFFNRPDSQDTWIFKGQINEKVYADIYLGSPGCDNRIAYELDKAGYKISNPSKKIKTYHMHFSNIRNYSPTKDRVVGLYKTIHPT